MPSRKSCAPLALTSIRSPGRSARAGGGDSPSDIQRGVFASEVGNIRLLNLFRMNTKLQTSFFIPGHSDRVFSRSGEADRRRGARDWRARLLTREPDRDDANPGGSGARQVDRPTSCVSRAGSRAAMSPRGGRCPIPPRRCCLNTDSSMTTARATATSSRSTPRRRAGFLIDYSKRAEEWMRPMVHGKEIDLVEFCGNWYVDDLPPMMFMKKVVANSHWLRQPRRCRAQPGGRSSLTGCTARWTMGCFR